MGGYTLERVLLGRFSANLNTRAIAMKKTQEKGESSGSADLFNRE
jgi:hypothetical protein